MAKYTFVRFRDGSSTDDVRQRLQDLCEMLTPEDIRGDCDHVVEEWPGCPVAYYAVQNSLDSNPIGKGNALIIGRVNASGPGGRDNPNPTSDGSYAVIIAGQDEVSFFTDQFGSRTLWYYLDESILIVSSSQRAVIRMKGTFNLNRAAASWFLSSGCQGPFISWDADVRQVEPQWEYVFDAKSWDLTRKKKDGMSLPASSSEDAGRYFKFYEHYTADTLSRIVDEEDEGSVLLPLSGGLDSRLLLALARLRKIDDRIDLVNWGVVPSTSPFDDKAAASLVAKHYKKNLLDARLPVEPADRDVLLDRFVQASECRIDHFNAYTDAFSMWSDFYHAGYRVIVRGDIPFTEGIDVDARSARAHIGLSSFNDFSNLGDYDLADYPTLQETFNIQRRSGETLIHWRDRLYVSWRIPVVISAFADLVNGYVENRSPMMSWNLFRRYMGLPERAKGDKKHIEHLAKAHDRSGVSFNATPSILPLAAAFDKEEGRAYVESYLTERCDRVHFPKEMTDSVLAHFQGSSTRTTYRTVATSIRASVLALASRMPSSWKGYLKAKRAQRIAPLDLAHRIVLADKAIKMYSQTAVEA